MIKTQRTFTVLALGLTLATACSESNDPAAPTNNSTDSALLQTPTVENNNTNPPSDPAPSDAPTTTVSTETLSPEELERTVKNLNRGYVLMNGVWTGFDPAEHPAIVILRDKKALRKGVLAINHPNPTALGESTAVPVEGLTFTSHTVTNPVDAAAMDNMKFFNFNFMAGGVDSFAISATPGDSLFDAELPEFNAFFMHEMFHRYQNMGGFKETFVDQSIATYPFTAENIELAVLEERALYAALVATAAEQRNQAIKHFAGLRLARRAAEPRVTLDDAQERYEGSAKFIEHRMAKDDVSFQHNQTNYAQTLTTDLSLIYQGTIKQYYGFARWYNTGASILELAARSGMTNIESAIEEGQSPADLLINEMGVTQTMAEALVTAAKLAYDPDNKLPEQAKTAAEMAESEPNTGPGETQTPIPGNLPNELNEEQIKCLQDNGFNFTSGDTINDELAEKCNLIE